MPAIVQHRFSTANQTIARLQRTADGQPLIVGYAAVYFDPVRPTATEYTTWYRERLDRHCFDEALKRDDVAGLLNHDVNCLLGRSKSGTLRLSTDMIGLKYSIIPGDTQVARDTIEHLRRGDITGSSFSFTVDAEQWSDLGGDLPVCTLKSVRLYDVGPVVFPAYAGTSAGV